MQTSDSGTWRGCGYHTSWAVPFRISRCNVNHNTDKNDNTIQDRLSLLQTFRTSIETTLVPSNLKTLYIIPSFEEMSAFIHVLNVSHVIILMASFKMLSFIQHMTDIRWVEVVFSDGTLKGFFNLYFCYSVVKWSTLFVMISYWRKVIDTVAYLMFENSYHYINRL